MSKFNQNCSWKIKFPCYVHVMYFVWALMGWSRNAEIEKHLLILFSLFLAKKQELAALGVVIGNNVLGTKEIAGLDCNWK